jgi:ribA/ribD-fused uncharacterized protein
MERIDQFQNGYRFLSNFWSGKTVNVECEYQAAKSLDPKEQELIRKLKPGEAKRYARGVNLRPDWEEIKLPIMRELVFKKFREDPDLRFKLLRTKDALLIEGNYWHDNFWGDCFCPKCKHIKGQNHLGRILMDVRNRIKIGGQP